MEKPIKRWVSVKDVLDIYERVKKVFRYRILDNSFKFIN